MDQIPELFGVDDSEELPEKLQEDGQADTITFLIAETGADEQTALCEKWLQIDEAPCEGKPEEGEKQEFIKGMLEKVRAIQSEGPKKKKKKKGKSKSLSRVCWKRCEPFSLKGRRRRKRRRINEAFVDFASPQHFLTKRCSTC